jgi:hypothetical protein
VSRRSTPERIDKARRAATRNSLVGDGATEATADAWIAAWEARAAEDGLARGLAYWGRGLGPDRSAAQDEKAADIAVGSPGYASARGQLKVTVADRVNTSTSVFGRWPEDLHELARADVGLGVEAELLF